MNEEKEAKLAVIREYYQQASEKLDYFLLGLTGAICAYEAQQIKFGKLGLNTYTLEVFGILLLVGSMVLGYLRLQETIDVFKKSHELLFVSGGGCPEGVTREKEASIKKHSKNATVYYRLRGWFLLAGFMVLLIAKMIEPYVTPMSLPPGSPPNTTHP